MRIAATQRTALLSSVPFLFLTSIVSIVSTNILLIWNRVIVVIVSLILSFTYNVKTVQGSFPETALRKLAETSNLD